jgi:hypothetical protein
VAGETTTIELLPPKILPRSSPSNQLSLNINLVKKTIVIVLKTNPRAASMIARELCLTVWRRLRLIPPSSRIIIKVSAKARSKRFDIPQQNDA